MRVVTLALVATLATAIPLAGCGYRTVGPLRTADGQPLAIELRPFENRSPLVGFEGMLADALAEELIQRSANVRYTKTGGPLAGATGAPDLSLELVVVDGSAQPYSYSSVGLALEYRVSVQVAVSLSGREGIEPAWTRDAIHLDEIYPASSDAQVERSNREQALRRIAKRAAGRISDELAQAL